MAAIELDVLLFGPLADVAAAPKVRLSVPEGTPVAGLLDLIAGRYPGMQSRLGSVAVAVNQAYVARSTELRKGDEVALIPPVSGG